MSAGNNLKASSKNPHGQYGWSAGQRVDQYFQVICKSTICNQVRTHFTHSLCTGNMPIAMHCPAGQQNAQPVVQNAQLVGQYARPAGQRGAQCLPCLQEVCHSHSPFHSSSYIIIIIGIRHHHLPHHHHLGPGSKKSRGCSYIIPLICGATTNRP